MPTITATQVRFRDIAGIRERRAFQYTGPASYATGGDPIAAADLGMSGIEGVNGTIISNGTQVRVIWWDKANGKLMLFKPTTGALAGDPSLVEETAATNLSGYTGYLEVFGK